MDTQGSPGRSRAAARLRVRTGRRRRSGPSLVTGARQCKNCAPVLNLWIFPPLHAIIRRSVGPTARPVFGLGPLALEKGGY
jgi:hypothetical protein